MESIKYYPKHGRTRAVGEVYGENRTATVCFVDVKGYIPLRRQVERSMANGERLLSFRKGVYQYEEGMVGNYEDMEPLPTQDPDFMPSVDMPVITSEMQDKLQRLEMQEKLRKESAHSDSDGAGVVSSDDGNSSAT